MPDTKKRDTSHMNQILLTPIETARKDRIIKRIQKDRPGLSRPDILRAALRFGLVNLKLYPEPTLEWAGKTL